MTAKQLATNCLVLISLCLGGVPLQAKESSLPNNNNNEVTQEEADPSSGCIKHTDKSGYVLLACRDAHTLEHLRLSTYDLLRPQGLSCYFSSYAEGRMPCKQFDHPIYGKRALIYPASDRQSRAGYRLAGFVDRYTRNS